MASQAWVLVHQLILSRRNHGVLHKPGSLKFITDTESIHLCTSSHIKQTQTHWLILQLLLHWILPYDAYANACKLPWWIFSAAHLSLPTSITIGIQDVNDLLLKQEYAARGFKILKVKLGENVEKDIEVILALHHHFAEAMKIRVDMNQGYTLADLNHFVDKTQKVNIELIEQPFKKSDNSHLNQLEDKLKKIIALDESMIGVSDMLQLTCKQQLPGIVNIKLMKCGGITPALQIAHLAELSKVELMWGCMDESIISISAALHAALSSPIQDILISMAVLILPKIW